MLINGMLCSPVELATTLEQVHYGRALAEQRPSLAQIYARRSVTDNSCIECS